MSVLWDPAIRLLGSPQKHWCRQRCTSRRVEAAPSVMASGPHRATAADHVPQLPSSGLRQAQGDRGQGCRSRARGRIAKRRRSLPSRSRNNEREERQSSPPGAGGLNPGTTTPQTGDSVLRAAGCWTASLSLSTRCQQHLPRVTTRNVSRRCEMPLWGEIAHS